MQLGVGDLPGAERPGVVAVAGRGLPRPPVVLPGQAVDGAPDVAGREVTPEVRTETLTYVAPAVTLAAPDGGALNFADAVAVRPLTATATSSAGDADARRAYEAFVRQSPPSGLPEFGKALEPLPGGGIQTVGKPGRYVGYAFDWVITSSFVRHCDGADAGGRVVAGSVTTFQAQMPLKTVVDCADPRTEVQEQAAHLMCGADA
ncbi:hypothetical protein [Kitasatospora griseola]|uniref:hypothetical protein n=1 Tax=Kitasatospora griseola TaxID=2064 RepID=UPI003812FD26